MKFISKHTKTSIGSLKQNWSRCFNCLNVTDVRIIMDQIILVTFSKDQLIGIRKPHAILCNHMEPFQFSSYLDIPRCQICTTPYPHLIGTINTIDDFSTNRSMFRSIIEDALPGLKNLEIYCKSFIRCHH